MTSRGKPCTDAAFGARPTFVFAPFGWSEDLLAQGWERSNDRLAISMLRTLALIFGLT